MFVGGSVRKYLLNQKVDDIDIATILKPEEIIKKFENSNITVKKTGIEHGTLTLVLVNPTFFEVTTLRKDISTDGRHASVLFTDNWEDDSGRDFTFNAIYLRSKWKNFLILSLV